MKTLWSRFGTRCCAAAFAILFGATLAQSQVEADGHGPDAWKVTGVASNDVLNMRMGPGTDYPVTDAYAHDANGIQLITCVPLISFEQSTAMSETDRANLPPRWCLTTDATEQKLGWVAARFLMEGQISQQSRSAPETDPVKTAVALVERLYASHDLYLRGHGPSPFEPPLSDAFFFKADLGKVATAVRTAGADPLYNAQDTDIDRFEVMPDAQVPVRQGSITVWATFYNFGQPQKVGFSLRSDFAREGTKIRIMRLSHDGWSLP